MSEKEKATPVDITDNGNGNMEGHYGAQEIRVLKGLEAVRKRPGMYIGGTGLDGMMHLIWEVLDNAIDESLAGHCDEIEVIVHPDHRVTIQDNGRGIPVELHPEEGIPTLELVMTKLHAGGKFDNKSYKVSGGLHGVGVSVVNALSAETVVEVHREGKIYRQRFVRGLKATELEVVGDTDKHGTIVTFLPDDEIFGEIKYDARKLSNRIRELAFLNPGLRIIVNNLISESRKDYKFDGGIIEFVQHLNVDKEVFPEEVIYFRGEEMHEGNVLIIELAMQYVADQYDERIYGFANNINTKDGGTHITGLKTGLTRIFNEYGREKKIITKDGENLSGDDLREGMTAVLSVKLSDPQFEGQTKTKLGNPEVQEKMLNFLRDNLAIYLGKNAAVARQILEKSLQAAEARLAAKKARQLVRRKGLLASSALPGKLADCSEKDPDKCELFIVEGDSAGGSAKQGRDRTFQAILPLRGKVLNVEKAALNKLLANTELNSMITALGTGIREDCDIERLRYGKIILLADADIDGAHITTLLLTFFFRNYRQLIDNGNVYLAQPPLYQIKRGKKLTYLYNDRELDEYRSQNEGAKFDLKRFKGLGEMNPSELWDTTLDPETRVLKQVSIEDGIEAEELFTILMGSEVAPRRDFIMENAELTTNLDI